jgi:hypothetical protein
VSISRGEENKQILYSGTDFAEPTQFEHVFRVFQQTALFCDQSIPCGGYLAHPFANQMDVLFIASCFSELWHSQFKEYKSISRVYLHHAEHALFIFSFGGS